MIYFKFKNKNFHQENTEKSYSIWNRFIRFIGKKIDCNPDYAVYHRHISTWYIEYDDVKYNLPIKEFGIDINGNILFLAPSKRNYGHWCDLDADIDFYKRKFNITYITAEDFYSYWNSYPPK